MLIRIFPWFSKDLGNEWLGSVHKSMLIKICPWSCQGPSVMRQSGAKTLTCCIIPHPLIPYWFVTQGQVKIWHDNDDYCDDDKLITWNHHYKKRKAKKAEMKPELMVISWHTTRMQDWCMRENKRERTKKIFAFSGRMRVSESCF